MPPDQLAALREQRALIARHLAWLDGQIAAATPSSNDTPGADTEPAIVSSSAIPSAPATAPAVEDRIALAHERADAIIREHSAVDRFDPSATRRGCIFTALAVFTFGCAVLLLIYFIGYR